MKMFVLTFLRGLSISLRSLKILVVIGVIVGVIVTYTAYKAAPVTKDSISNVVRNDFSGVSIKQTSQDGLRIIELYDRATRIPDLVGLKLLYQSVAMEVESGSGIVKINGDSAFKDESINARMDFFRIQINYISQPIMSGFILGLSISLLTYFLIIGAKGLQTTVKYIFQRLMETKKTIH